MRSYTPFLKLKVNEVAALEALSTEVLDGVTPFFDLPRKSKMDERQFCNVVTKSARKLVRTFKNGKKFYLDCYDIPDDIHVAGNNLFHFVAQAFADFSFIPVIGLDRSDSYLDAVFDSKVKGLVALNTIAIRVTQEDFESFAASWSDIEALIDSAGKAGFMTIELILDMRCCLGQKATDLAPMLGSFIADIRSAHEFSKIVVTGSSIPERISDIVATGSEVDAVREEIAVFRILDGQFSPDEIGFGDYTIVSPFYTDVDIPPELLPNITAPKVPYSYADVHFIMRGGALKTHSRGSKQYNDFAARLVTKPFFRKAGYSFGEDFIIEKANMQGNGVTPSSILKPMICTHMTYMVRDHSLFK
jgi:hypothetical protein